MKKIITLAILAIGIMASCTEESTPETCDCLERTVVIQHSFIGTPQEFSWKSYGEYFPSCREEGIYDEEWNVGRRWKYTQVICK